MMLPYRARCALRRTGMVLLSLVFLALLFFACWLIWLGRYVVYTKDGVRLDFSLPEKVAVGEPAKPTEPEETVPIIYGDELMQESTELSQLNGYYVDTNALQKDISAVKAQIQALPSGTPVMLDVKSIYGRFYYSSSVSEFRPDSIDIAAMDELIQYLCSSDKYVIARVPALRDYLYGLNNVSEGLPVAGGYLWMDSDGCYWLNPARSGTLTYLVQIANELKGLGFDEVVFSDFCFPKTDKIVFAQDKEAALSTTAKTLVTTCATDRFAVSFVSDTVFTVPEGRCRLYIENAEPANAGNVAQQTGLPDPAIRVVFLTELHDTRFNDYSVLRPLSAAH